MIIVFSVSPVYFLALCCKLVNTRVTHVPLYRTVHQADRKFTFDLVVDLRYDLIRFRERGKLLRNLFDHLFVYNIIHRNTIFILELYDNILSVIFWNCLLIWNNFWRVLAVKSIRLPWRQMAWRSHLPSSSLYAPISTLLLLLRLLLLFSLFSLLIFIQYKLYYYLQCFTFAEKRTIFFSILFIY